MTWVFLAIALASALLVLHPFVIYPASLAWLARRRPAPPLRTAAGAPDAAILLCAYNEERWIEAKAQNLVMLKRRHPGLAIHVYVDGATDRTAAILARYRHELDIIVAPERRGKTHGMNLLVARAARPILVFTDANVMLEPDAIERLTAPFADPAVGCVCGHMIYADAEQSITAATGASYWRLEERIKQLESETGSVMGADGALFAIRRVLHVAPPADIIDDMFVSLQVVIAGHRCVRAGDAIAREVAVSSAVDEFRRKQRIACQALNVHRLLWPRLRRLGALDLYKYVSHKLLRWFAIYLAGLSAAAFVAALVAAGYGAIALGLVLSGAAVLALAWVVHLPLVTRVVSILAAMAGTGVGVYRSLRGERFQTWSPAQSKRS